MKKKKQSFSLLVSIFILASFLFVPVSAQDVGVDTILSPIGEVDSTGLSSLCPKARIKNYGTTSVDSFLVIFQILDSTRTNNIWSDTARVRNLGRNETTTITFDTLRRLNLSRGMYINRCSTKLNGDINPSNDRKENSFRIKVKDVGCISIVAPTGIVDSGAVITPACSVYNYGSITVSYTVRMKIGTLYNQTATVTYHAPGNRLHITFPNWTASKLGNLAVSCSTELNGDMNPGNDRATGTVFVQGLDAQCVSVDAPTETVNQGNTIQPKATIKNNGNTTQSITARLTINDGSGYNYTVTQSLSPGQQLQYTFPNWTARDSGSWVVKCTTELSGDMNTGNDRATGSVFVQYLDAQCVSVDAPTGTVNRGAVIAPKAKIKNNGNTTQSITARLTINDGSGYNYTVTQSLSPGQQLLYTFPNWTARDSGSWVVKCTTELSGDMNPGNDRATDSVFVQYLDAQCVSIVQPTGTVNQGTVIAPKAKIENNGNTPQIIKARFIIQGSSGYVYNDTVSQMLNPNKELEYTFRDWTANNPGSWTVKCTTELSGDMNPGNDRATGSVFVQYLDAQCVSVDAPTETVNQGNTIQPKATIKNNGNTTQSITARLTIDDGSGYNYTVTQSLSPGQQLQYTFPKWTARDSGSWVVKCTTELSGDMNSRNDSSVKKITVARTAPAHFELLSPSKDTVLDAKDPIKITFQWHSSSPGVNYRFLLARDSIFSNNFLVKDTSVKSTSLALSLTNYGTYYWKVLASWESGGGDTTYCKDGVRRFFLKSSKDPDSLCFMAFPQPPDYYYIIQFLLYDQPDVSINIWNTAGEIVKTFKLKGKKGINRIKWDCQDENGTKVACGIYLVELNIGEKVYKKRIAILPRPGG